MTFIDLPRLSWRKYRAKRRGQDTAPILAEASAIGQELKHRQRLNRKFRQAKQLLYKSNWG